MKKKISIVVIAIVVIGIVLAVNMNKSEALEEEVLDPGYVQKDLTSTSVAESNTLNGREFTQGGYLSFEEYNQTKEAFCKEHGQRLTGEENTRVQIGSIDQKVIDPQQGQTIRLDGDPGTSGTKSESLAKYTSVIRKKAGVDSDWAMAYVMEKFPNNIDHLNGETQNAMWGTLGQAQFNELAEEAMAFQEYKQRVQNSGEFKGQYKIDLSTVSFDETADEIIVGPLSVKYERGFAKIGSRPKVDFGGIKEIKLYDQDGREIDKSIWKITYDAEHKNTRKERLAGDEDYGTTGSEFFNYPYSGEEFNIVLNGTKCKEYGITKITRADVILYDTNIVADYQDMSGVYKDVYWDVQYDSSICHPQTEYDPITGTNRVIPCEHGYTSSHEVRTNYRIVANVTELSPQKIMMVLKVEKTVDTGILELTPEPPRYTTPITPLPAIPTIISWPGYPSYPNFPYYPDWPDWPDYPDWPDWPDEPEEPDISLTIKLSGVVWEDTQTGKESEYDGMIGNQNDGTPEKGVPNVKVTLYKAGTKELAEAKENPVYTNEDGEYYFTRVPMGKYEVEFEYDGMTYTTTKAFANGSVEDYKNNPDDTKYVVDSKTEETQEARTTFNNKFYEISGDTTTATTSGKSYGSARDANGNKTADLEYITENGVSKLVTTDTNGYVKPEFAITASTATMDLAYPFKERYTNNEEDKLIDNNVYEANYKYMNYINLGLKRRPEADLAVSKDVSTATLTINKKEMTYKYNSRAGLDGFDITVKTSPSYNNIYYNREIYKSDYNYRIDDYKNNTLNVSGAELKGTKTEEQELKTFVTYKMTIRNQSGIPATVVNELVDYYDNTYNLVSEDVHMDIQNADGVEEKGKLVARKSYYETTNGQSGTINWSDTGKYQTDTDKAGTELNVMYTTDLKDVVLQSGEDMYIYVTFEVNKDANRAIMLGEKSNFIEINSFSTFESGSGKNTPTGQVDRDSAPGNLNPYDTATIEDDSDSAPTINIKIAEGAERTMNGIVWEDERTEELSTGQVVGDGLMDNNENKVNGVTVQLVELVDAADGNQYEYIWREMSTGENGYKYVDSNGQVLSGQCGEVMEGSVQNEIGQYIFSNYIPGNYIVRFKYGDTEKTLLPETNGKSYNGQDYKSTAYQRGENINNEWYDLSNTELMDSRVSDAKDNEARRLQVINYSKVMKFNVADVLYSVENNKTDLYDDFINNTWMYADTAKLKIQVEYDRTEANGSDEFDYNVRNIDFGIENRPVNDVELDKDIMGIKVTLADGNTIIDTENGINKNVNWVANNDTTQGKIHVYLDEELMQGANIEIRYRITVKNNGEIDVTGANDNSVGETYYTGKASDSDRIVTTSIDKIIDYVDNSLVFKEDLNPGWKLIENTDLKSVDEMKQNGYLDNNLSVAYKNIKNEEKPVSQIIVNDTLADDPLTPGQSASVELVLTKTISSTDEADDLSYNNVAETIQFTNLVGRKDDIPGNKAPYEAVPGENDSDYTEEVIITPPTGENRSTVYIISAIVILVVIAGVAVFVIRRNKKA